MGGGGKGGGGEWNPVSGNQQSGYAAFQPGQTAAGSTHPYFGGTVDPSHPDFRYYQQGWDKAAQDYAGQQQQRNSIEEMFSAFKPPEPYRPPEIDWSTREDASFDRIKGMLGEIGSDNPNGMYAFQNGRWGIADKTSDLTGLQYGYSSTGDDFASGIGKREQLFGDYTTAASSAVDYVNTAINTERSNAALMGVKYDITDEQKAERVNNYFATLWSDKQQGDLEAVMKEWGDPKGFEGFTVTRGTATTGAGGDAASTTDAVSYGAQPKRKSPLEEDDTLGGNNSILGG